MLCKLGRLVGLEIGVWNILVTLFFMSSTPWPTLDVAIAREMPLVDLKHDNNNSTDTPITEF